VTTTLAELEDRVRAILDEATAAQWSSENLRRWFNDGLRDIARTTRHYKSTAQINLVAGVAEYTCAENILTIEMCWFYDGTSKRPLVPEHFEQMDQIWGSHQDRAGRPTHFSTWGNSPTLKLRLWPVPLETNGVGGVTAKALLNTAVLPAEMPLTGNPTTTVDVPAGWVDLLVDYCEYLALRRDRDPRSGEAFQVYQAKRNDLIHSNDYLSVNRGIVLDPYAGPVPMWHVEDGWWD